MARPDTSTLDNLLRNRWQDLPASVRLPQQLAGIGGVACGATHGIMEKCNFACTSCYLSDVANRTRPLAFKEVSAQLDALREYLGPGGKAQITSGEVTLLDKHDLGRIVAYAKKIGLDPMVMTNGERLLQDQDYLPALVRDYGLRKISFHIDTTQRGRTGVCITSRSRERDIHWIRDLFADLVKEVRKQTGVPLHAAQTITVTNQNLEDVADIVTWALDNLDAFRLLSFLPVAEVGRTVDTRVKDGTPALDGIWQRICDGIGRPLNRHAMHFGHPQCNIVVPVLVLSFGAHHHVVEAVRANHDWDLRVFGRLLRDLSLQIDLDDSWLVNGWRALVTLLRRPSMIPELLAYGLYRMWGARRELGAVTGSLLRLRRIRIHPLLLVVHGFMSPDELDTPVGQERLRACVFKVPVNGHMVSMCEMNATGLRRKLNLEQLNGPCVGRSTANRTA